MKKLIIYLSFCISIVLLSATICISQPDTSKVKNDKTLNAAQVKSKVDSFLSAKSDNGVKKLSKTLQTKGFKAESGYFGNTSTLEKDGKTITNSVYLQDYKKAGKNGALGVITVSDGTNQDSYMFSLESESGNYNDVTEHYVNEKQEIVKSNSWNSCLYKSILANCGTTTGLKMWNYCMSFFSSWTLFVNCIKQAWCSIKAFACCSCDCSWWCKYAAGCCDR